jgi:hypothetical protein
MEGRTFGVQSLRNGDRPVGGFALMAVILPEVLLSLLLKKRDYTQWPMGPITEDRPFPSQSLQRAGRRAVLGRKALQTLSWVSK